MKLAGLKIIGIIFSIILISGVFVWSKLSKNALLKNHIIANAKITDCTYGGRGNAATITYYFIFYENDKEVKGSGSLNSNEISFSNVKSFLLGKTFPVVYNSNNAENNYLLVRPRDFEKFHYEFPDSIQWVLKYLHSK